MLLPAAALLFLSAVSSLQLVQLAAYALLHTRRRVSKMTSPSHRRNGSEGLNIGLGFPTTYSSFAASTAPPPRRSSDDDTGVSSSTPTKSKTTIHHRTAYTAHQHDSPTFLEEDYDGDLPRAHSMKRGVTFDSTPGSPISTNKSWRHTVKEFRKRQGFVLFFLAFSALLFFGLVLPVSRSTTASSHLPKPAHLRLPKTNSRGKTSYSINSSSSASGKNDSRAVGQSRFARWVSTLLGGAGEFSDRTETASAAFGGRYGDERVGSTQRYALPDEVAAAQEQGSSIPRRNKRRTADEIDADAHEHPSRKARRAAAALDEEQRRQDLLAKKAQWQSRVMKKVARAFRAGSQALAGAAQLPGDAKDGSQHVLPTYAAGHPELLDVDGDFAGF